MAILISSRYQFNNELAKAEETLVVANFHRGSLLEKNSEFEENYILFNIDMREHEDIAFSLGTVL